MVAELSVRIPGGPGAPAEARGALRRFHPDLPAELMQTVALLASELVANSVRHAGSSSIGLRIEVTHEHVRVDVADEGEGFVPRLKQPEPGKLGGWGLYIVDELATRWGVIDGDGTRVWFEIDR